MQPTSHHFEIAVNAVAKNCKFARNKIKLITKMETYKCYQCNEKFTDIKNTFSHLRNVHRIKDRMVQIKCVNNFNDFVCTHTFLTFDGLRKHLPKCFLKGNKFDEEVIELNIWIEIFSLICFFSHSN